MFCKHCGKEIKDGVRFCPMCGKPTGVTEEKEKLQQKMFLFASHAFSDSLFPLYHILFFVGLFILHGRQKVGLLLKE